MSDLHDALPICVCHSLPVSYRDCIDCQYARAGYKTKQGVVHFNVGNDAPPLKTMTKEKSDAHIVGVIFAQNFSLKKGLELFGGKADAAVHKELTQIHKMDTYEPVHQSKIPSLAHVYH